MLAPVAAAAWVFFELLGLVVTLVLFRVHRSQGATALLWGFGFAVFVWAGARSLGLEEARAIPLALVVWASTALFVYLRGSGLENPPAARPGAFYRRLRAGGRSTRPASVAAQPDATKTRELHRARVALAEGDLDATLYYLREAERVAVAQRKLDELLELRAFLNTLDPRTLGRSREATERLARSVEEGLHEFPAGALTAAGIHVEPERDLLEVLREQVPAGGHTTAKTRELSLARPALERGELAQALFLLQEAQRVAVAQRKLDELLEVRELVQSLIERSSGRTRSASEELARKVEAGLRTFLPAAYS